MTYSIIGSGKIGAALAHHFSRSGIDAGIANTRGPDSIAAIGAHVAPMTLQQAVLADVVILAVPFPAHAAVAALLPEWSGKIVVDAMNTYGIAPDTFGGKSSTEAMAAAFPGARVVKTFNHMAAPMLARGPVEAGGRRVLFVASDDAGAEAAVAGLVTALGFAPVSLGTLGAAARLTSFGGAGVAGPLVLKNFIQLG